MTRSEVVDAFRVECPEIPSRVISDATLYSWLLVGDKEFCAETRCIVDQDGQEWDSAVDDIYYDLASKITNFYDIDDYPGSGVLYNSKRLEKTTMAALDAESSNWRDRDSGTPKKWYRRGKYLYLDRKIDTVSIKVKVYAVLLSNDWITDVTPYNSLAHLEPFHSAMVLYLTKKAKAKVGKPEEAMAAMQEYGAFVSWAKKQLSGNKSAPIYFRKRI